MSQVPTLGGLLLAAGLGRRFGGNKLLHQVEGVSLIQRTFAAVPANLFTRGVLVSSYPEILKQGIQAGYHSIENPFPEQGQSLSVVLGLSALEDLDGVLFAVCDQPWLTRDSVEGLIQAFIKSPDAIVALSHQGRRGNPVIFPRALFPALLSLEGDQGGRAVIQKNLHRLLLVEVAEEELQDVDLVGDLG